MKTCLQIAERSLSSAKIIKKTHTRQINQTFFKYQDKRTCFCMGCIKMQGKHTVGTYSCICPHNKTLIYVTSVQIQEYVPTVCIGLRPRQLFTEPPTMSSSSLVMACWRLLLYCRLSSRNSSSALSVAVCMATMRAACSLALLSSSAV